MLVDKLFDCLGHINNLPGQSRERQKGELVSIMFTFIVDKLRDPSSFPNHRVNRLMKLTWRLVGNSRVNATIMTGIQKLHFYIERTGGEKVGFFACPLNWAEQCVERPNYCEAALVWASSYCRDFWNDRLLPASDMKARAHAWEAEYLLTALRIREFPLEECQRAVIRRFPGGVRSAMRFLYNKRRTFIDAT